MTTHHDSPDGDRSPARDQALIDAVLQGDAAARAQLADRLRCVPRILSALNARRGGRLKPQDLEDLTQDTLIIIWGKLGKFGGYATLESWAYRFCLLELMNRLRRFSRRTEAALPEAELAQEEPPAPILDSKTIETWLSRMETAEAQVLRLRFFGKKSFHEIAAIEDIPVGTARSRYYRGLTWLRERLAPIVEEQA